MKESFRQEKSSEIIICWNCSGRGIQVQRASAYEFEDVDCRVCGGSGRVMKRTVITYETLER